MVKQLVNTGAQIVTCAGDSSTLSDRPYLFEWIFMTHDTDPWYCGDDHTPYVLTMAHMGANKPVR